MKHHHATSAGEVPFTPEEEAEFAAMAAQAVIDKAAKDALAPKIAAIESYNNALAQLEDEYPQKERDTWPQQVTEARAYLADAEALTPLIDAMLTTKPNTTKAVLVDKIITNYTAHSELVGAALGAMQEAVRPIGS